MPVAARPREGADAGRRQRCRAKILLSTPTISTSGRALMLLSRWAAAPLHGWVGRSSPTAAATSIQSGYTASVGDEGVRFRSHIDEASISSLRRRGGVQERLGSDIIMALDECPPHDAGSAVFRKPRPDPSLAERCLKAHRRRTRLSMASCRRHGPGAARQSAVHLTSLDFPGYAIGA